MQGWLTKVSKAEVWSNMLGQRDEQSGQEQRAIKKGTRVQKEKTEGGRPPPLYYG